MSGWTCTDCTLHNAAGVQSCGVCGKPSPVGKVSSLPQGWVQLFDRKTGRWYYVNEATRTSHWTLPVAAQPNLKRIAPQAVSPIPPSPSPSPSPTPSSPSGSTNGNSQATGSWSSAQKQPWVCGTCAFSNTGTCSHCKLCGALNKPQPWNCIKCTLENPSHVSQCEVCTSPRSRLANSSAQQLNGAQSSVRKAMEHKSVNSRTNSDIMACARCTFIHSLKDWKECEVCGLIRYSNPGKAIKIKNPLDEHAKEFNLDSQTSQWLARLQEIEDDHKRKGTKFVDETFPPNIRSLYGEEIGSLGPSDSGRVFDWKRFYALKGNRFNKSGYSQPWTLATPDPRKPGALIFSPDSIQQGELGNCSFLSALAVVCTRPELIQRVFISNQLSPAGVYALRFWHNGKWTPVLVDDHLPSTDRGNMAFAAGKNNQLWPSLVEKAYAKINGNYRSICYGNAKDALTDLTGVPCSTVQIDGSGVDYDVAWTDIYSCFSSGCLMSASCGKRGCDKDAYRSMGLVARHCYTVLNVTNELGIRMIKLRNPWGTESWKGDWGPTSNLWTPETRVQLNSPHTNDGTFWMTYPDFINYFVCVDVCKALQDWKSISTSGMFSKKSVPGSTVACFSKPIVVTITSPTWLFLSIIQRDIRGAEDSYEYKDTCAFVMKVSKETSDPLNPEFLKPETTMYPSIQRIATCEGILRPGKYVIFLCSMLNQTNDLPFTLAAWSSKDIQLKIVESTGMHPYLVAVHRSIPQNKKVSVSRPFPGTRIMYVANGCALWFMAENRTRQTLLVTVDCSNSHGLISLRGSFRTTDTIPPGGAMLLQMLSATQQYGSWKWECQQKYKFGAIPELHDPPLPRSGSHIFQTLYHLPE